GGSFLPNDRLHKNSYTLNNRARYGGRSIIGGLFFLIKLALRYGIAHLINLFKQHSGRLYRWLIHSF
ncbi:MAG TPA: hypothetical protein PK693_08175, partial [Halothiobacillus sp.]|nr:hypothetical protein [Halothiobacillus sp.]